MIPGYIKDSETLDAFKGKIRKWKPINCPCRLCKKYIPNLGFIIRFNSVFLLNAQLTQFKGYFTLLVDASKMCLGFNRPPTLLHCGFQV